MNADLCVAQVSLLYVIESSDHSTSNHLLPSSKTSSGSDFEAYHDTGQRPVSARHRARVCPLGFATT